MTPAAEREWARYFVDLLGKFKGLELQYRIALKTLECIHLYSYTSEPYKPHIMVKKDVVRIGDEDFSSDDLLKTLTPDERKAAKKKKRSLKSHPDVIRYEEELARINQTNLSNVYFLEHMIQVMKDSKDDFSINRVIDVYNTYPNQIENWKKKVYAKTAVDQDPQKASVGSVPETCCQESGWPV